MAETPVHQPASAADAEYWCYHCDKRVSVETLTDLPDIICFECKNGFVESISAAAPIPPSSITIANRNSNNNNNNNNQEPSFSHQFLQILRLIAEAARDDDNPPPPPPDPISSSDPPPDSGDFLRIELNGWNNDEDEEEEEEEEEDEDDDEIVFGGVTDHNHNHNHSHLVVGDDDPSSEDNEIANEDEDPSIGEPPEDEDDDEEDVLRRRRRRDLLRLRIRDFASRATSNRNRILDWSEILMGLEDHTMEFRVEMPEWDGYVGNPEDYVDAAGYEALLQNLAESSDGGASRRGAPPASKSAISELNTVEITSEEEALVCAICKDAVSVGDKARKLPCEHGYHGDCILTWLASRNTCPVCRFELPTEDPDYEDQRKKRRSFTASSAGASGSNNTTS